MIRVATAADIPALHDLVESAFRGDAARAGWTHEADLLDGQRTDRAALADVIADPDRTILMTGDATGCVQVSRIAPGLSALGLLAVRPDVQAVGLGRRLVAAAEDYAARAHGAGRIEMTVIAARGELIAWYERQGYVRTGESRPFPMDDVRFGLPRQSLSFIVLERGLSR
ncbi:GCN5 family acetyltransferase [Sphingomonas sp. Leaf67]|uniref:GNAT family N-acetyltransferase n=1 Tax=Sphingomonas sp. Leaf67 TaxID=1736230 RepID=UPI00070196B9|nr:GNAT family N-acetyltransferase [Sphingomonas sp. Leaf67]KQN91950.1 GCN5 family acetyltransferase [Sphingomonas sp. Leaf67]